MRQVVEVACFTDASILITGESGTGKELVARLVHTLDPRANKKDLVVLDCTTVVPELSGSEFFGHERGAFTGAVGAREGAFALADGGTLFLDEVGELPLPLQGQLLRVVQERMYKRVGGNDWHQTEFRLVCATNRDLACEVGADAFRSDFYYRIASWSCRLPPLRERRDDILPLARHFIREFSGERRRARAERRGARLPARPRVSGQRPRPPPVHRPDHVSGTSVPGRSRPARFRTGDRSRRPRPPRRLARRDVRELHPHGGDPGRRAREIGRVAEDTAVRIAIAEHGGNLQRAAGSLGVTDRALQLRRAVRREQALELNGELH